MKWFVDYDQSRLFMVFTEPIILTDCGALSFEFSSGFNFSFMECSAEYIEYGTTIVYRLLDDGVVSCETTSDGHGSATETCTTYHLSYTAHSSTEVARRLLALKTSEDTAFLTITAGALQDYAESPNLSAEIESVSQLGSGEECFCWRFVLWFF